MKKASSFKQQWSALKRSRPGHRFQDRHERIKNSSEHNGIGARLVRLIVAAVSFVIGVVLVFIPGPAVVFFFISAGLLASESLRLARGLDVGEVWTRKAWKWSRRTFLKLPLGGKIAVGCAGSLMAGAGVWLAYTTFMS